MISESKHVKLHGTIIDNRANWTFKFELGFGHALCWILQYSETRGFGAALESFRLPEGTQPLSMLNSWSTDGNYSNSVSDLFTNSGNT